MLHKFKNFKQKWILMKAFLESQFEVIYFYDFQTRANSYEDICWVSVWSYVSLWFWNQSEFSWRYLLSLILKLHKFMNFKQKWIFMKTLVESQLQVIEVYELETKSSSDEDTSWVSAWSYVSLWVSKQSKFLWRHLLSLGLKLCKLMSFKQREFLWMHLLSLSLKLSKFISIKQKEILMKTFMESQFRVI